MIKKIKSPILFRKNARKTIRYLRCNRRENEKPSLSQSFSTPNYQAQWSIKLDTDPAYFILCEVYSAHLLQINDRYHCHFYPTSSSFVRASSFCFFSRYYPQMANWFQYFQRIACISISQKDTIKKIYVYNSLVC